MSHPHLMRSVSRLPINRNLMYTYRMKEEFCDSKVPNPPMLLLQSKSAATLLLRMIEILPRLVPLLPNVVAVCQQEDHSEV